MHPNADDHVPSKGSKESTTKEVKQEVLMLKIFFTISQLSVSFIDPLLHASLLLMQWYTISTMLTPLTPASFTQIYELLLFLLLGGHS